MEIIVAKMERVQVYFWEGPAGTVRFLIPRALEVIAQRQPAHPMLCLTYDQACEALKLNPSAKTCDFQYALRTDLNRPLIAASMPGGHVLIDGWHRLIKQVVTHTHRVPLYILTEQETKQCII